jgi:phosphoribosylformylglycinamidine synthase
LIYRIFVEKKENNQAAKIKWDINNLLGIDATAVREILLYDIENIEKQDFEKAVTSVFSEPPIDKIYFEKIDFEDDDKVFAISYLDGQYDQRADSAAQCVQLLTRKQRPLIKCARVFAIKNITASEFDKIKKLLINPVESQEISLEKPNSLLRDAMNTKQVETLNGFINFSDEQIENYHKETGFAMTADDLKYVRDYFKSEKRNPTITEIKVIDTYWSDHCRHTTFSTEINNVKISSKNKNIEKTYALYQDLYKEFNGNKPHKYPCLMDIATIAVKKLKKLGKLNDLDESDEINACSIEVDVDVNGKDEKYLVMFKNETHNHPTEIEPFGGAATCLGGAIRDPLSGRTYVYQAMRITGCANPNEKFEDTLSGKLPQRVITKTAAAGFSSYGNQIGLATGIVDEMYHDGYKAKRLETGFVVGAAKKDMVYREKPADGDIIILLGGETGRDGCGGATGSSKAHTCESVEKCGAEVQKGNPLTERKIQRLFLNKEVTTLIKKCNDFGAGGVAVAIGELSDALIIDLDKVPKKYEGLSGTELAISESQERMAVVVNKENIDKFIKLSAEENLTATPVAVVTSDRRMKMKFKGQIIVDISRDFLDTNGVKQVTDAEIDDKITSFFKQKKTSFKIDVLKVLSNLNVCSKKGLSEMFDSTIGARTVFMPFGGKNQLTPSISMAAKIPVNGITDTATVAAYGCQPDLMKDSPYTGSVYSVIASVAKLVASGCNKDKIRLTFQEYFMRLGKDKKRWGAPLSALLGALSAQLGLGLGAIGGKDSMSGTFENIDVPPTLISFGLACEKAEKLITNVIEKAEQKLYFLPMRKDKYYIPDFEYLNNLYKSIYENIQNGNIEFATVVESGGIAPTVIKSCLGNGFGFVFLGDSDYLLSEHYGDLIISAKDISKIYGTKIQLGTTIKGDFIYDKKSISIDEAIKAFTATLENVFPTKMPHRGQITFCDYIKDKNITVKTKINKPKVFIPVFPGTNCELDTKKRFELAGGDVDIFVIKNRNSNEIEESVNEIAKRISSSQIIAFPGGFSGGDEPDGSGKFIATTFKNPLISNEITNLLDKRDGLILGICNGFQALIKLGLVPYGKVCEMNSNSPTLTYNKIARHVSTLCNLRISSNKSPWFNNVKVGDIYSVAVSHGEGRFVANETELLKLINNGQIATQYADLNGNTTMISPFNPNGSVNAIEGITSPDGRILGKMGHSERIGNNMMKNYNGSFDMKIFEAGIRYFK